MTVTPYSYREYTGNGSNKNFQVPFPYLLKAHVKVYSGLSLATGAYTSLLADGVDYVWTSATNVQLTVAPATGVKLTVKRETPTDDLLTQWQDGSTLIAEDLLTSDKQNLYAVQEEQDLLDVGVALSVSASNTAAGATATANAATATANTALSTASTANSTANAASATAATSLSTSQTALANSQTAVSNAAAAVTTSQTAASNAATALSTSQTASTNAAAATVTANAAAADAATSLSTANTSLTNSQTATQNAATALTNSQTSLTQSAAAVTTANNSNATAASASSVAASASTAAASATTTANTANSKADQAIAAVSSSINYTLVTNVAGIPASPANDTYVEVGNSTGIESFTPLAGKPAGFVGDSGLSVRMRYTTAGATWNWQNYYPNNAETRYLKLSGGTLSGNVTAPALIPSGSAAPSLGLYAPSAGSVAISASGTQKLLVNSNGISVTGNISIPYATAGSASSGDPTISQLAANTGVGTLTTNAAGQTLALTTYFDASQIAFRAGSNNQAGIQIGGTSSTLGSTIQFATNNSERLRITSSGLVGVGVSAPSGTLEVGAVAGAVTAGDLIVSTGSTAASVTVGRISSTGGDSTTFRVRNRVNSTVFVVDGPTERVGIGASAPQTTLETASANASGNDNLGNVYIRTTDGQAADVGGKLTLGGLYNASSNYAFAGIAGRKENATSNNVAGYLQFLSTTSAGALTERMRLDSQGRLAIGTTDINDNLTIAAANYRGLTLQTATSTDRPTVYFRNTGAAAASFVQGLGQNLIFGRAPASDYGSHTETARIDASGRLLVGTSSTSAAARVLVAGGDGARGVLNIAGTAATPADGDDLGFISFNDSSHIYNNALIRAQRDGGSWTATTSKPTRLTFSTSSDNSASPSERVRISSTGAIGLSGANYGTSGQVLTSSGSGAAPTWKPAGASIGLAIALG